MDSAVYGCADGSEVDRGRGLEVALYAEGPTTGECIGSLQAMKLQLSH